jgi:hypothetical protein
MALEEKGLYRIIHHFSQSVINKVQRIHNPLLLHG